MVVDERPREDFGKMILKVATGLVLPKLVDTFLNTAFNKNKVYDLTTETSDTIIQDNKNSTTDKFSRHKGIQVYRSESRIKVVVWKSR